MNIGKTFAQSRNRLLTTIAYRLKGETSYAIEGSIFIAGAAVQWLRDGLGVISQASETERLAASVEDTGGVYMVPAFTGLGAPYWDPDARGALLGLTRDSGVAHIARAALEAQAYQTQDLLDAMAADTGTRPSALRVDGGMVVNDRVCQFLADINDLMVERPAVTETTALGAAYLAGLGAGLYSSLDEVGGRWRCERSFIPAMGDQQRRRLYDGWKAAVARVRSR
jgi:glycerol kinase